MSSDFVPELDTSEELNADDQNFYQEMIGILRWATEIGRVDILTELSLLSAYQASPRRGHFEQVIHIFAFLKKHPKLTLYFDAKEPKLDPGLFLGSTPEEFREIYRDAEEELPPHMPEPRGRRVTMPPMPQTGRQDELIRGSYCLLTGHLLCGIARGRIRLNQVHSQANSLH